MKTFEEKCEFFQKIFPVDNFQEEGQEFRVWTSKKVGLSFEEGFSNLYNSEGASLSPVAKFLEETMRPHVCADVGVFLLSSGDGATIAVESLKEVFKVTVSANKNTYCTCDHYGCVRPVNPTSV